MAAKGIDRLGKWAAAIVVAGTALALTGCDMQAHSLYDGLTKVESLSVNPGDSEEVTAVETMLMDKVQYEHALAVLKGYYDHVGVHNSSVWAQQELQMVRDAQPFRFTGVKQPAEPQGQSVVGTSEAALLEQVVAAREAWQTDLDKLEELYSRQKADLKLKGIRTVKGNIFVEKIHMYVLNAEVPPATARPTEVIDAADRLYDQALKLHLEGKLIPALADYDKEEKALKMFLDLVKKYPTSNKLPMTAYYIAEIYKEYFKNQEVRAVLWYQRAWEWDPHIPKPARFQAAVLYDYRLKEHGRALPLYYDVIKYETFNKSNCDWAANRIDEIKRGYNIK